METSTPTSPIQLDPRLPNELSIIVRFTISIPDLLLSIPNPAQTTIISLKHLIRSQLEEPTSNHRFRLIHSGKLLRDGDILSAVVHIPPPPPRAPDPKGKGKAVDPPPPRVYINCSIGDVLTSEELAAEARAAVESVEKSVKEGISNEGRSAQASNTTPAPRGFDRLLSGGFTAAEVNQLRLQFLSIQSSIHTADTMPSQEVLRQMEDAWIDNNAGGAGGNGFDFGDNELGGGALDDILWGNIIGFLWPLGCLGWAIREEGIWSSRRKLAIYTGFFLSMGFGCLNVLG